MAAGAFAARPPGFRTALVCMPFSMADRPSIQIALLAALARRAGFECDTHHLNLELAALIPDAYDGLCSHRGRMTGEWLFSVAAFGADVDPDDERYYRAFPEELGWAAKGGKDAAYLSMLRHDLLPRFIDRCVDLIDWSAYGVVGFSSTFQQNAASLALASRIKRRWPEVTIVFGGANMEADMGVEYARAFPFVDHVVTGEGDVVFPALLRRLAGQADEPLPGVTSRIGDAVHVVGHPPPLEDMDALPLPDYDEYFERHQRIGLSRRPESIFAIPFESSRGCWWGEKHHCTFCGLNGEGMKFRAKTAGHALEELSALATRHGVTMFQATDNILDMKYLTRFFSTIQETRSDFQFFYETKSNLTHEQIAQLRRGGVRWLQPGIESLSTHVLQLMRKGCTMLQNVRTLKWSLYHRIRVGWNLIWGFPGESEEDYRLEYDVLRLIPHLEPPNACGRIWMERFSPVFFDRGRFPAQIVGPERSYTFAYPPGVDLMKAAYFFDYELENTVPDAVHLETQALVAQWKVAWHSSTPPTLTYRRLPDALLVDDNRGPAPGTQVFHGPMALIYEYCSPTMHTASSVAAHLEQRTGVCYPEAEVTGALDEFCRRGIMVGEGGQYLALALPANINW
jgi:ribosomal peptide maturation radical SAM protein 1